MSLNLYYKLPKLLQGNEFWTDFVETLETELGNVKSQIDLKKALFNVRQATTIDELRQITDYFGVSIDVSLLEDDFASNPEKIVSYLQREAEGILYRIQTRGIKDYYDYIFNRVSEKGMVYLGLVDDNGVIFRAIRFDSDRDHVLDRIRAHDFTQPFTHLPPLFPYKDGTIRRNSLDSIPERSLDTDTDGNVTAVEANAWTLDEDLFAAALKITKHIFIEFMADEIYTIGSTDYLISKTHLDYLGKSVEFGRRVVETPHVGVSLSLLTLDDGVVNTIAANGAATQVTANYNSGPVDRTVMPNFFYMVRVGDGNGANTWNYERQISEFEILSDTASEYDFVHVSIPGWTVYPELVGTYDTGSPPIAPFTGTLAKRPVLPSSFLLTFKKVSDGAQVYLIDDGFGRLYFVDEDWTPLSDLDGGDYAGTIDYNSGDYSFDLQANGVDYVPDGPNPTRPLNVRYQPDTDLIMNELSIFDNLDNEIITATFPAIQFANRYNHASFQIIVKRNI